MVLKLDIKYSSTTQNWSNYDLWLTFLQQGQIFENVLLYYDTEMQSILLALNSSGHAHVVTLPKGYMG